ncbi:hypothetical protein ASE74_05900 [Pedobacter sp. Leaf216]|uniref:GlcG/HbpS family heme-binding protein n=1 Tax=Pedobacter sp. Leaf216 TaxID=1735684 RepID=UPI0006FDAC29|nr:heme-binding protein [Pedobacter sp. Leaf216]KQM69519.1 hypothetical protein ASE74_05900 [Pedobacter sp. Leaf216]
MKIKYPLCLLFLISLNNLIVAQVKTANIKHHENPVLPIDLYFTSNTQLTLKAAYTLTEIARNAAATLGKDVSIAILDQSGVTILISRGDGVGPHNTEAARRKAYTALSTKTATLALARKVREDHDSENLANLPELLLLGGGVPLWYENKVVGSIGVAGGGSVENDDKIAKAALDAISDINKNR